MILITTSIPFSFFQWMDYCGGGYGKHIGISFLSQHHGRPLLPHPLPLPSDDGTIQQSTINQFSTGMDKIPTA
jgi:hypothetical protein